MKKNLFFQKVMRDPTLSIKAKGLYMMLILLENDEVVEATQHFQASSSTAMQELQERELVTLKPTQVKNKTGIYIPVTNG